MLKSLICTAAAAAALSFTSPANAALLNFSLTGDYTANWTLDSNPTPDDVAIEFFDIDGVSGNFPGTIGNVANFIFFAETFNGGLQITDPSPNLYLFDLAGPQLFSGPTDAPTFLTGTFALTDYSGSGGTYTLVISEANGVIPEPATWAMMIAGFGLVGSSLRRRREQAART